jgi:hypothetical protein
VQRTSEPKFQKALPRQSLDKMRNLFIRVASARCEGAEWQTRAQRFGPICCSGTKNSQGDGVAIKAGNNLAIGLCFECDVAGEPGRKRGRCNLSASLS